MPVTKDAYNNEGVMRLLVCWVVDYMSWWGSVLFYLKQNACRVAFMCDIPLCMHLDAISQTKMTLREGISAHYYGCCLSLRTRQVRGTEVLCHLPFLPAKKQSSV